MMARSDGIYLDRVPYVAYFIHCGADLKPKILSQHFGELKRCFAGTRLKVPARVAAKVQYLEFIIDD